MKTSLLRGSDALRELQSLSFQPAWRKLVAACPWATSHQSVEFITTWYDIYQEVYEAVVVLGRREDGDLAGLWFFAIDRAQGQLVSAGTIHAEYHAWLSHPEDATEFVLDALRVVKSVAGGTRRVSLVFAPPACPTSWLAKASQAGVFAVATPQPRGILPLKPDSPVSDSLRKKSNKSRIARLQHIGPLSFQQLHCRAELAAVFPEIIEQCDRRQQQRYQSTPFLSDPLKKEFYLAMMDHPGLLHATVLRVGDRVAAAHLGHIHGHWVSLGLITHALDLEVHSPGKFAILYLARMLQQQGYAYFDLTPGGEYKQRFAQQWDETPVLDIFFSPLSFRIDSSYRQFAGIAKPRFAGLAWIRDK